MWCSHVTFPYANLVEHLAVIILKPKNLFQRLLHHNPKILAYLPKNLKKIWKNLKKMWKKFEKIWKKFEKNLKKFEKKLKKIWKKFEKNFRKISKKNLQKFENKFLKKFKKKNPVEPFGVIDTRCTHFSIGAPESRSRIGEIPEFFSWAKTKSEFNSRTTSFL